MKFLLRLWGGMLLGIVLLLLLGLFLKCDHNKIIEEYSFQPEDSTAMSHVRSVCEDCGQRFHMTLFRDNSPDENYMDVIAKHSADRTFVKGEYDTIKAIVTLPDYKETETEIHCMARQDDVKVYFCVGFKREWEDAVSELQEGDEIVFYGKSALTGLSWTNCELLAE